MKRLLLTLILIIATLTATLASDERRAVPSAIVCPFVVVVLIDGTIWCYQPPCKGAN